MSFAFSDVVLFQIWLVIGVFSGAQPRFKSWGGPNRAKPESRARSVRDLRAKPESRAKPEKERGEGVWGGGSVSPFPENF